MTKPIVNYPDDVRAFVAEQKTKNVAPEIIAESVRCMWPQYQGFTKFSVRALTRTRKRRKKSEMQAEEEALKAAKKAEKVGDTCPYITVGNWPNGCGRPGTPYCDEHAKVVRHGAAGSKYHMAGAGVMRSMF